MGAADFDPFPDVGAPHPLVDWDLEAAAVRAQRALGSMVDPADISHSVLAAICTAIDVVRARGDEATTDHVLDAVMGIDPLEAIEAWCWFDIGGPWRLGDPEAVLNVRRMAWWRRKREACLRAAIACEQQDMEAAADAIAQLHAQLQRALARVRRVAA